MNDPQPEGDGATPMTTGGVHRWWARSRRQPALIPAIDGDEREPVRQPHGKDGRGDDGGREVRARLQPARGAR
jgi:hypothetical protein